MQIAAEVLSESVNRLGKNQNLGLVAYGHRQKGDCKDVEILVDMKNTSKEAISSAVGGIKPLGKTPLAYAAGKVIDELRTSAQKATVILITDGIESCDGDICKVVKDAKQEGIDFKLHIVGFGLKQGETEQLICAAGAGDGQYYNASNAQGLNEVMMEATSVTVDEPPGNVSVYAIKNGKAIDAVVRAYDLKVKRRPKMARTYADTAYVYVPPGTYNLEVTALGGSDVKPITISDLTVTENNVIHKTVSFDAGKIRVMVTNNGEGWDAVVKVLDDANKNAGSGRTYQKTKDIEVNPGTYSVNLNALAMEGNQRTTTIEDLVVSAGGITEVSHDFKTGKLFVDARVGGESIDSVVKISEVESGKNVAGSRTYTKGADFLLNPGTYEVSVKPLGVHKDKKAQTFSLKLNQGDDIKKQLNF
ncbi:MAG: hypothetical protein AAF361_13720, partial [Bacteroidota bacterium]